MLPSLELQWVLFHSSFQFSLRFLNKKILGAAFMSKKLTDLSIQLTILRHLYAGNSSMLPDEFPIKFFTSDGYRKHRFKLAVNSLKANGFIQPQAVIIIPKHELQKAFLTDSGRQYLKEHLTLRQRFHNYTGRLGCFFIGLFTGGLGSFIGGITSAAGHDVWNWIRSFFGCG
jgi:hypothetical protein